MIYFILYEQKLSTIGSTTIFQVPVSFIRRWIFIPAQNGGNMMNNKLEDLLNAAKINELIHKKELEERNKNGILIALAIIGAIAAVAGIAYAVYKYFTPDYLDDFDDDFEDDFEDDFIEFSDSKPTAED